ncbi:hypothetical protein ACWKWP_09455 [Agromyces soli]
MSDDRTGIESASGDEAETPVAATGAGQISGPAAQPGPVPSADSPQPLWVRAAFALVFGLLLAYDVWEVVGSLVTIFSLGAGLSALGWAIMIVALLAPVALFAAAFVISRRRGVLVSLLAYATAVAVSGALFSTLTVLLGAVGGVVV